MASVISSPDTLDGWFLFNNSVPDASQDLLLINQTVFKQVSQVYGSYGMRIS